MRDEAKRADAERDVLRVGDGVSVTRLPSAHFPMARVMGVGTLLDPLEAGRVVRVRLDEGRAFAPSEVLTVDTVVAGVAIVETRNHRYEFRRIAGAPSEVGVLPIHDDGFDVSDPARHGFETQVVSIDAWPEPDEAAFVQGARIDIVKESGVVVKDLGAGILLCDLVSGEPLSMTVGSEVVSTSPVSAIRELGPTRVEVRTGNSRYTLRLKSGATHDG